MSAIILQEDIVHYEVLGRGRPLIFLHGWVGSWRYWIPSMQSATVSFRAYALDFWGFGDTAKRSSAYTLDAQVELLDGFMEKMGIGRVALIGHGLGAVVALMYAARFPRFVDRVMGISLPVGEVTISPRLSSEPPEALAEWLLSDAPVSESVRVEAPKADALAIRTSLEQIASLDLLDLALNLPTPCLLVHGQLDPAISLNDPLQNVYALPPNTHHILFEQSGHFPMLDEPSKFNRLMADFLALSSGESPQNLQLKEEWKRRVR
ncbi:MAG: alpha/beta hydrolase [Anaerolineae bacterium]|nr:MAG: alpha/beta hydrolase [Anaerolineae bacterium]